MRRLGTAPEIQIREIRRVPSPDVMPFNPASLPANQAAYGAARQGDLGNGEYIRTTWYLLETTEDVKGFPGFVGGQGDPLVVIGDVLFVEGLDHFLSRNAPADPDAN
jgi:hypothetical protein